MCFHPSRSRRATGVGTMTSDTQTLLGSGRFAKYLWWTTGCVAVLIVAFAFYARAAERIADAYEQRYRSYLLADELRHSGDDLTRMARTYVQTGDEIYRQHFDDILAIRDGRKPRPLAYGRPYWDLTLKDQSPPRGAGPPAALLDMMRLAGFTDEEFGKLAEAKTQSDRLTAPELEAMALVGGGGPDVETRRARAIRMLIDDNYHLAKAAVMGPIAETYALIDDRTAAAVSSAEVTATALRITVAAVGVVLILVLWRTYVALGDTLGGSVDDLRLQIAHIGQGDFASTVGQKPAPADSVRAWLSDMQARLSHAERERASSESVLKTSEQRYRTLFEAMDQGFCVLEMIHDAHGNPTDYRLVELNPAFERQTGFERALGKTICALVPDHDRQTFQIYAQVIRTGQPVRFETNAAPPRRCYDVFAFRIDGGGESRVGVLFNDITARRQAEVIQSRIAAIVDSSSDAIIGKTVEGEVTSWNTAAERLLGYSAAEMIGQPIARVIPPALAADELRAMERAAAGSPVDVHETVRVHKNGDHIDISLAISPVKDAAGAIVGVSAIMRDLTEINRARRAIEALNAGLERRVAERTAQLEASNAELEAFSYSVSHDLRAPLRAIDGYGRMLREDYEGVLNDEGRRLLGVIGSETRRMGDLIDDLLTFSRLGRQSLELATVDMTELVRSVFESQAALVSGRELQLKLDALPPASGDRSMLHVMITNLVSNAIKFTQGRMPALIEIGARLEGGDITYYVKDNGVGFDMAYAGKLFGVFQRLHSTEQFEGTGVGLALAQRVVHRHGGRIWAKGQVDRGAAFYFSLAPAKESR